VEPLDTAALPELPEGWLWATLAELARSSSYGTSVKCSYDAIGAAVVRIPNIRSGRVDLSDLKKATENLGKSADDALRPGDLLIVRTNGSEDLIGRGAIVTEPLGTEAYFASYLIRFRLVGDHHLWRWIGYVFNSPIVRKWMISHIASSAGQYNVSQTALASLPLPIPPASEIRVLGDRLREQLGSADDANMVLEAESKNGLALRRSILKAAFEGRMVAHDPTDEPAPAMLARLRKGHPRNGARRRKARAAADFFHPSLPGLTGESVDPRVEPAGDE
jgi:type I restriction enzyme S subunit